MRCPNCNCDVPEGSLFCPECGQKLEGVNGSQAENSGETYNDQRQDAEDVYGDQRGIKRIHTMIGLRIRKILFGISLRILQIFMEPHLEIMEILMGISLRIREASVEILLRIRILEVPMEISPRISAGPYPGRQNGGNTYWRQPQSQNNGPERMATEGIILITACRGGRKNKNPLIIIIAVVAIVASVGGAAFFALRSRAKDETIQKVADSSDYSIGNTDVSGSDTEAESVEKDAGRVTGDGRRSSSNAGTNSNAKTDIYTETYSYA